MPKCDFCDKELPASELIVDSFGDKWCSECQLEAIEEGMISCDFA